MKSHLAGMHAGLWAGLAVGFASAFPKGTLSFSAGLVGFLAALVLPAPVLQAQVSRRVELVEAEVEGRGVQSLWGRVVKFV